MIFAGLGVWFILTKRLRTRYLENDSMVFVLFLGLVGVYVSSAFVRLEVFASISLIVLSSVGLSILTKEIFQISNGTTSKQNFLKFAFVGLIISFFIVPLVIPEQSNWISISNSPPIILNGGTGYAVSTNDWKDSLEWIKLNTPKDSVIAAWWDYGYWISTMSERATLTDNATLDSKKIQKFARILVSPPEEAWKDLQEMGADYVVVFVSGEKIQELGGKSIYVLRGGGDESKKQWFMRIAGEPLEKYLFQDGSSGTDYFWNNTLLGKLFPFSTLVYVEPNNSSIQSQTYKPGLLPLYTQDIKYPAQDEGPFKFVYGSPSFVNEDHILIGVFVYEINHNYIP